MNLLPRFWDVDSGAIRIDGHDIREVQLRSLRRQIGIVLQETILFQDTIANNIAYGYPHASRAAIIEAAERAYAHQFIMALPQGYDTVDRRARLRSLGRPAPANRPGPRHASRSRHPDPRRGDQRRRYPGRGLIRKAIEEFAKGRTTFLISHNLASIQVADRIVLLERRPDRGGRHRPRAQAILGPLSPAPRDSLSPRNRLRPARPDSAALESPPVRQIRQPRSGTRDIARSNGDRTRQHCVCHPDGLCSDCATKTLQWC